MVLRVNRLIERSWKYIHPEPNSGCWLWAGSVDKDGYGKMFGRPMLYMHREFYALAKGPIPPGMVIDHLCRTPACCNPEHLEAVTRKTNTRRGRVPRAAGRCKNGHVVAIRGLYTRSDGYTSCRRCVSEAQKRYQARKRA